MHHVEILACSTCAHCRHVTDVVADACVNCDAEVHAVDLTRFPEVARRQYGLMESPIVVVDGRVVAAGVAPRAAALREMLTVPS